MLLTVATLKVKVSADNKFQARGCNADQALSGNLCLGADRLRPPAATEPCEASGVCRAMKDLKNMLVPHFKASNRCSSCSPVCDCALFLFSASP